MQVVWCLQDYRLRGSPLYQTAMDKNTTGRAGEFFAAYTLERYGIECHHVDREGADLWCKARGGPMFTVQVKTATKPSLNNHINGTKYFYYSYALSAKPFDYFCFVALDRGLIRLLPRDRYPTQKSVNFSDDAFTAELQDNDISIIFGGRDGRPASG